MKKLNLSIAIAAATMACTGAHASVGSQINRAAIALLIGGVDIEVDCATTWNPSEFVTNLGLVNDLPNNDVHLNGNICVDPLGGSPFVALNFVLKQGAKQPGGGTIFSGGFIDLYVDYGPTSGWFYYTTINAATTPINCLPTGSGSGGIQWNILPRPAPNVLAGMAAPACGFTLFGNPASLYLTGTNYW